MSGALSASGRITSRTTRSGSTASSSASITTVTGGRRSRRAGNSSSSSAAPDRSGSAWAAPAYSASARTSWPVSLPRAWTMPSIRPAARAPRAGSARIIRRPSTADLPEPGCPTTSRTRSAAAGAPAAPVPDTKSTRAANARVRPVKKEPGQSARRTPRPDASRIRLSARRRSRRRCAARCRSRHHGDWNTRPGTATTPPSTSRAVHSVRSPGSLPTTWAAAPATTARPPNRTASRPHRDSALTAGPRSRPRRHLIATGSSVRGVVRTLPGFPWSRCPLSAGVDTPVR